MDIQDFEGITKFKVFIPLIYIFNWIFMAIGPVLCYQFYNQVCIGFLIFLDIKIACTAIIMTIITIKSNHIFNKIRKNVQLSGSTDRSLLDNKSPKKKTEGQQLPASSEEQISQPQLISYGFIIPSYKQDIDMMTETLQFIASHKRAESQYHVFLAMEAHEENSQLKAKELMKRFEKKFKVIDYTHHKIRENEQKGKASNVSWCAQHLQQFFEKYSINPQNLMLTIMDADSWAPDIYFEILEEHLLKNYEQRHKFFYQPPQIFTRNNLDVPIFTRVYDLMHSFLHCCNLFSIFNVTFPLSNYTISYNLAKRMGFWDTCADAIGEDFHTLQKAFWKTNGDVITIPIYTPFNQVNISTGDQYIENVLARFWQAERHAQGVSDFAWQIKMLFSHRFKFRNFLVFYQIFENAVLPAFLPWIFISLSLQNNVLFRGVNLPATNFSNAYFYIFNILTVLSVVTYLLFEKFKRTSNTLIYNRKNESFLRIIEYFIFFSVNMFSISVPTFVIAAFGSLFSDREYVVAEKKMKK